MSSSSSDPGKWFACPRLNPNAETRLFLFPYAGGGPTSFSKWSLELPENMEARTVHYPGRGSRYNETPIASISSLAHELSQAIRYLLDKPFVFFGHSLGAWVAFELARNLQRNALPAPTILFVSGSIAPHLSDPHFSLHALPDPEFLDALKNLNGIPNEIIQDEEALALLFPQLRADFELIETYRYKPGESLSCPIIAFGGLGDPRTSRSQLEGWAVHTSSHFESCFFSGDHFFIHQDREKILQKISSAATLPQNP